MKITKACVNCGACINLTICLFSAIKYNKEKHVMIDKTKCVNCKICKKVCLFMAIKEK